MGYYNENTVLFYDGKFVKATAAPVSPYLQTLHYGYGVFEGIRSYATAEGTRIFKAKEHYDRLIRSCKLLNIPFDYSVEKLTEISYEVLNSNGLESAYIRPLVICDDNMSLVKPTRSILLLSAFEWPAYLGDKLLKLKTSSYCRPHPRSVQVEAKACGYYVNSILATSEAKDAGYDEALMLDHAGFLAEGPGANLFFEKDGKLFTPELGHILAGITRATVFEICEELGIECEEGQYLPEELQHADSAFYCGTGAEIAGIETIDGKSFNKTWNDSQGKKIQQAYQCLVREQSLQSALSLA